METPSVIRFKVSPQRPKLKQWAPEDFNNYNQGSMGGESENIASSGTSLCSSSFYYDSIAFSEINKKKDGNTQTPRWSCQERRSFREYRGRRNWGSIKPVELVIPSPRDTNSITLYKTPYFRILFLGEFSDCFNKDKSNHCFSVGFITIILDRVRVMLTTDDNDLSYLKSKISHSLDDDPEYKIFDPQAFMVEYIFQRGVVEKNKGEGYYGPTPETFSQHGFMPTLAFTYYGENESDITKSIRLRYLDILKKLDITLFTIVSNRSGNNSYLTRLDYPAQGDDVASALFSMEAPHMKQVHVIQNHPVDNNNSKPWNCSHGKRVTDIHFPMTISEFLDMEDAALLKWIHEYTSEFLPCHPRPLVSQFKRLSYIGYCPSMGCETGVGPLTGKETDIGAATGKEKDYQVNYFRKICILPIGLVVVIVGVIGFLHFWLSNDSSNGMYRSTLQTTSELHSNLVSSANVLILATYSSPTLHGNFAGGKITTLCPSNELMVSPQISSPLAMENHSDTNSISILYNDKHFEVLPELDITPLTKANTKAKYDWGDYCQGLIELEQGPLIEKIVEKSSKKCESNFLQLPTCIDISTNVLKQISTYKERTKVSTNNDSRVLNKCITLMQNCKVTTNRPEWRKFFRMRTNHLFDWMLASVMKLSRRVPKVIQISQDLVHVWKIKGDEILDKGIGLVSEFTMAQIRKAQDVVNEYWIERWIRRQIRKDKIDRVLDKIGLVSGFTNLQVGKAKRQSVKLWNEIRNIMDKLI